MKFKALAIDYDGTLALHEQADELTVEALQKLSASGRKLVLVTGRLLDDLMNVFPAYEVFDRIVAENGALLYRPQTAESRLLCAAASTDFIAALQGKKVAPLVPGSVIVATVTPNETVVLETIRELGLELHIIFNKGAVMVLPAGITKASGLKVALEELEIAPEHVVAAGDGENDHALLESVGFAVAIAGAVPKLQEAADYVTEGGPGVGAIELIQEILRDDLQTLVVRSLRRQRQALKQQSVPAEPV